MVRILTDSASDFSPAQAAALNVSCIPLHVTLEDGRVLRDGIDTDGDWFFSHLTECKKLPTTSQPSPDLFAESFDAAKAAGDETVAILLSSALSGTFQSARIGAEMSHDPCVELIDSGTVALGEGLLVRLACQLRDQGLSASEIGEHLARAKRHLHLIAVADDLKFLRKGGRLPAAAAIAGSMLGIKPLITIQDGKVALAGKVRGLPGAYVALFRELESCGGPAKDLPCIAAYTTDPHQLEPVRRIFERDYAEVSLVEERIGCVVGTHIGTGAFGIAFFDALPDASE